MEIQCKGVLQIPVAVNRVACSSVPAFPVSRSKEPTRLDRASICLILFLSVFGIRPHVVAAENELLVRFQSPARGEIVSRYADGTLTVEGEADFSSGKWWTGTYSAKLSDLDFENVNFGTFTTEPGAAATLSCKANSDCVSKKGKWAQIKCDADICNKGVDPNGTDRITTWNDDPWAGESYSALTVTVADGDDDVMAAPVGRVHFAGEHTAGAWAGLMEGALRSGARAASEVLSQTPRTVSGSLLTWCHTATPPSRSAADCRRRSRRYGVRCAAVSFAREKLAGWSCAARSWSASGASGLRWGYRLAWRPACPAGCSASWPVGSASWPVPGS